MAEKTKEKKEKDEVSPMMRKYLDTKEQYKDCILMYRLGDFYEMFFDDAELVSRELDLTLTGRNCGLEHRAPMCGVPYHAVDGYVARLVNKGYKVAICEQLSEPMPGKTLVDREVVRVITAGTVIDEGMISDGKNNYLASVFVHGSKVGFAWADITTGEFNLYEKETEDLVKAFEDFLATVNPSEIIASPETCEYNEIVPSLATQKYVKMQAYYDWAFKLQNAIDGLTKAFNVLTLDSFGVKGKDAAICAAGALNEYLHETQKRKLPQFTKLSYFNDSEYMLLDSAARRTLELFESNRDRKKQGSLFWVIDKTRTGMGLRTLRKWLDYPVLNEKVIAERQDAVEFFYKNSEIRDGVEDLLSQMHDIERLAGRSAYGNASPSDMLNLAKSLEVFPKIKAYLKDTHVKFLDRVLSAIPNQIEIGDKILKAFDPDHCGKEYKNGGFILKGYDPKLDSYRDAKANAKGWLEAYELKEKEATGIKNLHVGFNRVFGYYIEVSNSNASLVPFHYHRKQTLTNGERYITEELKAKEEEILHAEEYALQLELDLFEKFSKELMASVPALLKCASAIGALDAVYSLAKVAFESDFVRPIINKSVKDISIENGRHPVVEKIIGRKNFIPNDTVLDDQCRTMILTGPNMSGKSTYMRQVALITILAHIGSFVPATKAEIALTDRVFTRIGANDDLTYSQSTFMVEMVEVATVLNNATKNSLLILDEIGRGTSTYDGLGIAWSVMEYIAKKISARTLFATHYQELTDLENRIAGVKNYRVLANKIDGKVVFLHKIARGGANKSFGAEVASLAGVPEVVVERARKITDILEETSKYRDTNQILVQGDIGKKDVRQASLFEDKTNDKLEQIGEELKAIDINSISPIQAFSILADLISKVK